MRVAVDAYFNNNLGDDLFLEILLKRYKGVQFDFMITDSNSCLAFRNNPQVNFISRKKMLCNILKYDAYILIGGSLFQEPEDWRNHWRIFNLTVSLFKILGKSSFVLGCNFGPFDSEEYKNCYTKTFKKLTHMTVRDNYSFEILSNKGINLSVHPDIVLSKYIDLPIKKNPGIVGISIIDWPKNSEVEEYIVFISELVVSLIRKNRDIRLFAFQNTEEISDLRVINRILDKLDASIKSNISTVSYNGDLKIFLEKYAECYSMVTTRFHSLILSLKYLQNIFPIIYSKKTLQTLDYLKLNIDFIELENLSMTNKEEFVASLLSCKDNYEKAKINNLIQYSQHHFSVLDKVLRK